MDGEGILRSANGDRYKGRFKQGLKHGKCIEILADGTRFEGYYNEGERDGKFVEYDKNGNKTASGKYVNGRRETK